MRLVRFKPIEDWLLAKNNKQIVNDYEKKLYDKLLISNYDMANIDSNNFNGKKKKPIQSFCYILKVGLSSSILIIEILIVASGGQVVQ